MEIKELNTNDLKKIIEDENNIEQKDGWFWVLLFIIFAGGWEKLNNAKKQLQELKRKDGDEECMDMGTATGNQEI